MNKYYFIVLMFCLLLTASAWGFYEDFATTGDQYSLYGGATVSGGHLLGTSGWGQGALMDGSYTPTAGNPLTYKTTFNMDGSTENWATAVLGFGSSGAGGKLGQADGFLLGYMPNLSSYIGSWNASFDLIWNPSDPWTDIYSDFTGTSGVVPGGFDLNADYELILVDSGDSVDFWLQLASDPSIKTNPITVDISGYTRFGDVVNASIMKGGYIDDVRITGAGEPVGTIDPGSLSISEPSGSDTYVITLNEAIPAGADFRVYLDPCDLWDGGLQQATVAPAKAGDPNTALDITFTSANWDTPVTVTVAAFDDSIGEEDLNLMLSHSLVLVSGSVDAETDPNWADAKFANGSVSVSVGDDDQRYAVEIDEIDPCGIEVSEQGATSDIYTVVLKKQPVNPVTIDIATDGETTTNPASLTFVSGDWNVAQTVTVTAVDDTDGEDDPHIGNITNSVAKPAFIPGSVLFEDFEDEIGLNVTLDPNAYVDGGLLRGTLRSPMTSSLVNGSHPAIAKIEVTYNMLGETGAWFAPVIHVGRDGRTGEIFDGLAIAWYPLVSTGYFDITEIDESWWSTEYYTGYGITLADYDPCDTYVITVVDYGVSLDVTVAEAADPCNNFSITGIDVSGYARAGDGIGIGLTNSGGGIEEITVTDGQTLSGEELEWLQAPVEFVGSGDGNAWVADNDCRPDRVTLEGDIDGDCDFDLADFARMAANWMDCTLPNVPGCI